MSASASIAANVDDFADAPLADMALSWIDHDVQPRVILDHMLDILWANTAARSALARRSDLENRSGRLQTTNWTRQEALRTFVLGSSAAVTTWHLPRAVGTATSCFAPNGSSGTKPPPTD